MAAFKRPLPGMGIAGPIISPIASPLALTPSAISTRELHIIEAMLKDVAPQWSVELHGISFDDTSLIILPEDGEDALGPSFMISQEGYGLRLDQFHWDELTEIGAFPTLSAVVDVLVTLLRDATDFTLPPSATIH